MKRMLPIVLSILTTLTVSAGAFAQAPDQAAIDKALLAAPGNLKEGRHGNQMEGRLHLRDVEEGHQQPGLLRQVGDAWPTAR